MPTKEDVAYTDVIRGLDGQVKDLDAIRAHVALALTGGGIAAAVLVPEGTRSGAWFWIGVGAFVVLAVLTVVVHLSVSAWGYDFNQTKEDFWTPLVENTALSVEALMRNLIVRGGEWYQNNQTKLRLRWRLHNLAFFAFALEVVALLLHSAND